MTTKTTPAKSIERELAEFMFNTQFMSFPQIDELTVLLERFADEVKRRAIEP